MNSTIPKRNAGTLRNRNVPFQLKNQNGDRNGIDNYGRDREGKRRIGSSATCMTQRLRSIIVLGNLTLEPDMLFNCQISTKSFDFNNCSSIEEQLLKSKDLVLIWQLNNISGSKVRFPKTIMLRSLCVMHVALDPILRFPSLSRP